MSDRIFATIWLLLCLAGASLAWQYQSEYSYEPLGPRPFPLGILGLMALCALLLLRRQPDTVSWPPLRTLRHLAIMVAALAGYGASFEWLGFPLATALLTFVLPTACWAATVSCDYRRCFPNRCRLNGTN